MAEEKILPELVYFHGTWGMLILEDCYAAPMGKARGKSFYLSQYHLTSGAVSDMIEVQFHEIGSVERAQQMDIYTPDRYASYSDEALVDLAVRGDSDAIAVLLSRYLVLVRHDVRRYHVSGIEADDLFQEAMIGFLNAVRTYRRRTGTPFRSYAAVCMHRHVASVVRWGLRQKNRPLDGYVPLDDPLSQTALADGSLSSAEDPEQLHIEREEQKAIRRQIQFLLSDLEKEVLRLYLACVSYEDMAKCLNTSVKSVDNALQRIRRKLRSEYRRSNL